MNKKGFTLVELLAVLIILGIEITITATSILKQIKDSKKTLTESQINLVKTASIEYADKKGFFKTNNTKYNICIESLKKEGLIDDDIINTLKGNYYVELTVKCENKCYFSPSDLKEYKNSSICN